LIFVAALIIIAIITFLVLKFWIPKIKGAAVQEHFDQPVQVFEKPETMRDMLRISMGT